MDAYTSKIEFVNGMKWGFFDKLKKAYITVEGSFLVIRVGDDKFEYKKGDFYISLNHTTEHVVVNGEGNFIKEFKKTPVRNMKFRMPAKPFRSAFFEELKTISDTHDFFKIV